MGLAEIPVSGMAAVPRRGAERAVHGGGPARSPPLRVPGSPPVPDPRAPFRPRRTRNTATSSSSLRSGCSSAPASSPGSLREPRWPAALAGRPTRPMPRPGARPIARPGPAWMYATAGALFAAVSLAGALNLLPRWDEALTERFSVGRETPREVLARPGSGVRRLPLAGRRARGESGMGPRLRLSGYARLLLPAPRDTVLRPPGRPRQRAAMPTWTPSGLRSATW